eukprot:15351-Heterococcus_DN1.PRE.1
MLFKPDYTLCAVDEPLAAAAAITTDNTVSSPNAAAAIADAVADERADDDDLSHLPGPRHSHIHRQLCASLRTDIAPKHCTGLTVGLVLSACIHFSKAWKWGPSTTINNANNANNVNDSNNNSNTADASWEQRQHAHGATVIVVVNGREVPTYHVFRNKKNWGFMLVSCWCLYTSWRMPKRYDTANADAELADDALQINVEDQWAE